MAGAETPLGIIPGGRGNDLARVLGIPTEPEEAIEVVARRPQPRGSTSARPTASASSASSASASTPKPTGSPTRPACCAATSSTPTPALRTLVGWKPARFTIRGRRRAHPAQRLLGLGRQQPAPTAAACSSPPTPSSTTASSTSSPIGEVGKLRFVGNLPKVFKGTHVEEDEVQRLPRPAARAQRQPPVPGLRRRRAPHRPAGLAAGAAPRPARAGPAGPPLERRGGASGGRGPLRRQARAGAGDRRRQPAPAAAAAARRCRAGCCCGSSRRRSPGSAPASTGGATIVSATNGKTTTAGMIAADPRRRGPPAGPQPGRLEHDLGRGDGAARAARRARGCSRSTRPGCRGSPQQLDPRLIVLGNLFRDQLDRYGEMEALADEWAKAVARARRPRPRFALNADDPLIADLGRDAERAPARGRPLLRDRGRTRRRCRSCSTPSTPSTAAAAATPTPTSVAFVGHLGHYSCPNCGAERPRPDVAATRIELRGMERLARRRCASPAARSSSSCRCPASTTSTTRWRRSPRRCELGVDAGADRRGAGRDARRLRPGRDDRGRRRRRSRSC